MSTIKSLDRHEDYLNQRNSLINHAQLELDNGNIEASNQCRAEIEALDKRYREEVKERKELANLVCAPNTAESMDVSVSHGKPVDIMDFTNTVDYRKAFKDSVLRGKEMPLRFQNADANTLTTDVAAVIPTVIVNRIIEQMEAIGMILPLVTRTSYAAGVSIPTTTVKPVATWVSEGTTSDRQKTTVGAISFMNHKLRCEISMSMEVATMSIDTFEAAFVRQVSEAMTRAIEGKIMSADTGTGSPKSILSETPPSGQAISVTALDYPTLVSAEGLLPQSYENGASWFMSKSTFMSFVGMVDTAGQPIARMDHGLNNATSYSLLGRTVVLCGDYMTSYNAAAAGDVFAFLFRPRDYVLNTVYDMGIQRKQSWETEDMLTKAVMSVDGKVVDVNSLVTLTKGAVTP